MAPRSYASSEASVDESYFFKTYVPLSNLPTPPPSSHSSFDHALQTNSSIFFPDSETLDPELLGPAIHLTNLIPSSTSLIAPSLTLVHAILTRANLPLEIVALAVCILDSLSSRFALSWRQACPLATTHDDLFLQRSKQHIDSIHPEIIVLSALILAVKFLDDTQQPTREYASEWGKNLWTCEQVNFTQRALLENLGYRLLPLWDERLIIEALEDMERAGKQFSCTFGDYWEAATKRARVGSGMSTGKAMKGIDGMQLTPVETPMEENVPITSNTSPGIFSTASLKNDQQAQLSDTMAAESFPIYIDPIAGF